MDPLTQLFIVCLLAGLLLIGLEIFVPGGILGTLGGIALFVAVVLSFKAFSTETALFTTAGIILLLVVSLILWIRYFPRSPVGRSLTLNDSIHTGDADPKSSLAAFLGKKGVTRSACKPSGIAEIDGQRIDVVAQSGWIEMNSPVVVIETHGNHLTVKPVPPEPAGESQ